MARYSDNDLERALRTVASLIERYGDAYWPILEKLEEELVARRSRAARLAAWREPGKADLLPGRMSGPSVRQQPSALSPRSLIKGKATWRQATRASPAAKLHGTGEIRQRGPLGTDERF